MRILNVIVTSDDNGLDSIDSFGIIDEQDSPTVVEQAEELFVDKVMKLTTDNNLKRDDVVSIIEDGAYELHDEVGTTVWLSWSSIDNVQL